MSSGRENRRDAESAELAEIFLIFFAFSMTLRWSLDAKLDSQMLFVKG